MVHFRQLPLSFVLGGGALQVVTVALNQGPATHAVLHPGEFFSVRSTYILEDINGHHLSLYDGVLVMQARRELAGVSAGCPAIGF